MLRNTRIRTRLAAMAAGPAIVAVILTTLMLLFVPGIAINGDTYDKIMVGMDFQAQTVTPSLYIVEINSAVQKLVLDAAQGESIQGTADAINKKIADYEAKYATWAGRITDPTAKQQLNVSHEYAEKYFELYQKKLLPALASHQITTAASLLSDSMEVVLGQHKAAVQDAAKLVGNQVTDAEAAASAKIRREALAFLAITLLIMAASIALGITVLRSITDRVRRLIDVATVQLPQVLEEVKHAAAAGEEIPPLPGAEVEGRDELTAATAAFNHVVGTAIDLAAEQTRLRKATSQMFVSLGRRNHKLLSRTLTYITQLESDERDPATLQNLFRLDHLTTRMRRHAESLLVLAGSPPLRTWSRPVPIADVLRAALSEIETYDRVDIRELEPVEVRGASVSDLAHLLAELLENATAFSPPQTRVRVLGRTDTEGYTVVVVDDGIGMTPQEFKAANELITSPEASGLMGDSRMLGLGVVGRLAARHGLKVNLTAAPAGGVVAWVTLPASTLAPRRGSADAEPALGAPSGGGAAGGDAEPAPRAGADAPVQPAGADAPVQPAGADAPPAGADRPGDDRSPSETADPQADGAPQDAPTQAAGAGPATLPSTALPLRPASSQDAGGRRTAGMTGPLQLPLPPDVPATGVAAPAAAPDSMGAAPAAAAAGSASAAETTGLTRRVRGAQLPDTGQPPPGATTAADRPDRSANSVRGALASFNAGRRSAAELTSLGGSGTGSTPLVAQADPGMGSRVPGQAATADASVSNGGAANTPAASTAGDGKRRLPRRVKGAQMPETDLPASAPAPDRSAAEVRAALSNFVAGRRAAEHED